MAEAVWKVVEKANHLAVHAHCHSEQSASRWISDKAPAYCARGYFMDKSLTPDSFTVIPPREVRHG